MRGGLDWIYRGVYGFCCLYTYYLLFLFVFFAFSGLLRLGLLGIDGVMEKMWLLLGGIGKMMTQKTMKSRK